MVVRINKKQPYLSQDHYPAHQVDTYRAMPRCRPSFHDRLPPLTVAASCFPNRCSMTGFLPRHEGKSQAVIQHGVTLAGECEIAA